MSFMLRFISAWICSNFQSYRCRVSAFTQDGQLIPVNSEHSHNASIGKLATRKVLKDIKALSKDLKPAVAVASAILPVTDVLWTGSRFQKIEELENSFE